MRMIALAALMTMGGSALAAHNAPTNFVWKDATGATVPGAVTTSFPGDVYFADGNGYIWTMETDNLVLFEITGSAEVFESLDCSGPGYIQLAPTPRWIIKINTESTYRVIRDDAPPTSHHIYGSSLTSDGCSSGPFGEFDGIPLSATIGGITPPAVPYQAPLHPEVPR